jgi:DNA-binding NarL/FixJ family response regulator
MPDTVLVVEDSDFTRMLLATAVTSLGYASLEAANATDAMRLGREHIPAMALIDLDLGDGPTGADLARGLRRLHPMIGLAIVTSYEDPRLMGNLPDLPEGTAYLVKASLGDLEALRRLIGTCTTTPLAARTDRRALDLSDSQLQVMRLVALGYSNAEIAKELWITVSAVEKSVHRLASQLHLEDADTANRRVLIAQAYYQRTMDARNRDRSRS